MQWEENVWLAIKTFGRATMKSGDYNDTRPDNYKDTEDFIERIEHSNMEILPGEGIKMKS